MLQHARDYNTFFIRIINEKFYEVGNQDKNY